MHMIVLHEKAGSDNPLGASANYDRLPFATSMLVFQSYDHFSLYINPTTHQQI